MCRVRRHCASPKPDRPETIALSRGFKGSRPWLLLHHVRLRGALGTRFVAGLQDHRSSRPLLSSATYASSKDLGSGLHRAANVVHHTKVGPSRFGCGQFARSLAFDVDVMLRRENVSRRARRGVISWRHSGMVVNLDVNPCRAEIELTPFLRRSCDAAHSNVAMTPRGLSVNRSSIARPAITAESVGNVCRRSVAEWSDDWLAEGRMWASAGTFQRRSGRLHDETTSHRPHRVLEQQGTPPKFGQTRWTLLLHSGGHRSI